METALSGPSDQEIIPLSPEVNIILPPTSACSCYQVVPSPDTPIPPIDTGNLGAIPTLLDHAWPRNFPRETEAECSLEEPSSLSGWQVAPGAPVLQCPA